MSDDEVSLHNQNTEPIDLDQPDATGSQNHGTVNGDTSTVVGSAPRGLYVAWGAVTASAVANAVVGREPRRKAYIRHVILTAAVVGLGGAALVICIAALFG